jgi:NADH-quinone oxidoreductase subunit G
MPLVKITFDDKEFEVEAGTTILNAARQAADAGILAPEAVPPAMCYYSKLETSGGKCRVCIVKVTAGSAKDPRPMPKPVASCRTNVQDGMVIKNLTDPSLVDARKGVVEFLLINHPLDCPVCDQAGECHLQDLGYEHGQSGTRYEFERRTFHKIDIGDKIKLHMTRCILCYRCTYVADQLTPERVHGILGRGDHAEISTHIMKAVDNEFSGNMIDVCPVGALTDKTFRFMSRVWFLKPMDAHRNCDKCSGKAVVWMFGDAIYRVNAPKDAWGEVENYICNTCRFEKKKPTDWVIDGPRKINRHSVISQNHYARTKA